MVVCGQTQAAMAAADRTSVMKKGATEHFCSENVDQIRAILKNLHLELILFDFQNQGR